MQGIIHLIQAGGVVMYPLLLLSLVTGVVIVERCLTYRKLGRSDGALLDQVLSQCRAGRHREALGRCDAREGATAACLAAVLRHRHLPPAEIERRVEEVGQAVFQRLERYLPVLDTSATIAPLLGLLGTILGMVGTFNSIAGARSRESSDAILAGIGEALYATATGLIIAIAAFVAYNAFAARLRTVTADAEQATTRLLNVLTELPAAAVSAESRGDRAATRAE